jgi:UDP-glucose 4-epimerase
MNVSIVAGGAGFVGTNLLARLLSENRSVVVIDNMSRGSEKLVKSSAAGNDPRVQVFRADCSIADEVSEVFERAAQSGEVDEVWHLAANSDIPAGVADADVDLKDTFLTTHGLLKSMKHHGVGRLHFASSSAIYGDLGETTLREDIGPLLPISNYGAMKLASEALISAAAESYLSQANIFRFPNVVGVPATHGVILDFVKKLIADPDQLSVLGDGTQQKSYLHVSDLIDAMLLVRGRMATHRVELINIGPVDEGVTVRHIAQSVVARVSPGAQIVYGVGNKGWIGDVPKFNYSTAKLQGYGWTPRLGSAAAVERAVDEVASQLDR